MFLLQKNDVLIGAGILCGFLPPAGAVQSDTALLRQAAKELTEYFTGQRRYFDLPLNPSGTAFQMLVWQQMARIPYGQTCSYGQLASAIGRPGAARAVGGACHRNPLLIFQPCHRVVGSTGALTGFAAGLAFKQALLELELKTR